MERLKLKNIVIEIKIFLDRFKNWFDIIENNNKEWVLCYNNIYYINLNIEK